jgi:hypothetical protein
MSGYKRRADFSDMPLAMKLGILQHELGIAVTAEEKKIAQDAVDHMLYTIEKLTPKPFVQKPGLPIGFTDMNR